jgi:hypothetical protein
MLVDDAIDHVEPKAGRILSGLFSRVEIRSMPLIRPQRQQ